jgi:poly(3-hydroxybutyrate) depolymerase
MAGIKASSIAAVCGLIVLSGALTTARSTSAARPYARAPVARVRIWTIRYRAHDGRLRRAFVELPAWYGPRRHPAIPLVISPHGRGVPAEDELRRWGDLPALGRFAVVHPEGQGRRLTLFAWGDPGDISDLAKMPWFVERALPWLRVDRRRIYAFGASMGGQETLLLVARHAALLAGAAAFDAPTNMAARCGAFPLLPLGRVLQRLARVEIGGTPATDPHGYAIRSPLDWARQIAFSGVPLQIWWSTRDGIVVDQRQQSGALYREAERLNRRAPVREFVGTWPHTMEMRAVARLPIALGLFGLVPPPAAHYGAGISRGVPLARTCRWTRRRVECGPPRPLPEGRSAGGRRAHANFEAARNARRFTPPRRRR